MIELRIHGRGGQGVVTMADLLGRAALSAGKEAQTLPFFGVERRGAVIKACVRISGEPILMRSMSYRPDAVVLMHENLLSFARQEGFAEGEEGAVFIVNGTSPVEVRSRQWVVDADGIARAYGLVFGGEAYSNVPMLGAIARVLELPFEHVEIAIGEQWHGKAAEANLAAAKEAYETIASVKEKQAFFAGQKGETGREHSMEMRKDVISVTTDVAEAAEKAALQPLSRAVDGAGGMTGAWRSQRPRLDSTKCTDCLLCWLFCPEAVIAKADRTIDYLYCKGCGICACECPANAIEMIKESENPVSERKGAGERGRDA